MGTPRRRSCGGWPRQRGSCCGSCRGAEGALPEVTKETELTAETPYDEMYRYYVGGAGTLCQRGNGAVQQRGEPVEQRVSHLSGTTAAAGRCRRGRQRHCGCVRRCGGMFFPKLKAQSRQRLAVEQFGVGSAARQRRGLSGGHEEPVERRLSGAGGAAHAA